ncbi:RNA chaperone Hfq [Margalitia sp. FSL K6-0131]|uniref:RNA chaperone Hfq n=1 Tax=Margalitia sp. FSL K6-0131 TaxID=2954604 RepID=UPI0030F6E47F
MSKAISIQDILLNEVKSKKINVTVILMNGHQIKGTVTGFDSFVILISPENSRNQQMIYKHTISTIIPTQKLELKY